MRRLVALLIVLVVCLAPASTTTANAVTYTYDGSALENVAVVEFDDLSATPARSIVAREGSASRSVESRGTSTTDERVKLSV